MAGPKDVTVRVQQLDGTWDTLGNRRARGVWPEGVTLEADLWGSSKASFSLRRDPTSFWPDIGAFTPVEIDVGSTLVWSGRVSETPARVAQRVMNVQCEGWQYHLDDDLYQRFYVHTRLGDYRDIRTFPTALLGNAGGGFAAAAQVASDQAGSMMLSWPANGGSWNQFSKVGIGLDFAAFGALAKRIVVTWESSNNDGQVVIIARTSDTDDFATSWNDAFGVNTTGGSVREDVGTFSTARRFVGVFLQAQTTHTPAVDVWVKIKAIKVFVDTAYESGNASILKASTVVADGISRGTALLSTDTSGITATSFSLPEYAPSDPQTPRQAWTAVDSFHDWHKQIDVNKRPIYQARPSRPVFEVGAWSAIDDDDASANSGEDIYNRALLTVQTPDGQALNVSRYSGSGTEQFQPATSPAPPSTSATSGLGASPRQATITFSTGTFEAGKLYRFTAIPSWSTAGGGVVTQALFYVITGGSIVVGKSLGGGTITNGVIASLDWVPDQATAASAVDVVVLMTFTGGTGGTADISGLGLSTSAATIVDRRRFQRTKTLPISAALPSDNAAANQIGDVWLAGHKTTPFKGSVSLTGDQSLRNVLTGHNVPLEQLLLNTGQLLRFSDRADPDTGGHGRDGRIAAVTYTPATDTAAVTIDNSRSSFEALMSRLSVIQGG